jgi:TRAP-type mannitol/chloroaromatic compound transport system permease small subunit
MTLLTRLSNAIDRLNEAIGRVVSWLVLLMVLIGAFNALARYSGRFIGVNLSSNAWLELQWYLFSLVFLLAAGDVLRRDAHVRVDVLLTRLGPRGRAMIDIAGTLIFLLPFCVFALWASLPTVQASWAVLEVSPDPGGLPRYPIKSTILIAFVLLFLQGISQLIKSVAILREPAAEPGETS